MSDDHRSPRYRDGVIWRWTVERDWNLSDLARAVALHLFEQPRLPAHFDAARLAAEHGTDERAVDLALDELMDGPGYVRLFPDGAVFLTFDRWNVRARARQLAHLHHTTIGRVLTDARNLSTAAL